MYTYTYIYIHTQIYIYIHTNVQICIYIRICIYIYLYIHIYICIYTHVYMAAPQKHRACNGPGRPFGDKACNRMGGSCDKPSLRQAYYRLQYSTQRLATRVCNRGPATKVCNRGGGGGPQQTPISSHSHIYVYIHR